LLRLRLSLHLLQLHGRCFFFLLFLFLFLFLFYFFLLQFWRIFVLPLCSSAEFDQLLGILRCFLHTVLRKFGEHGNTGPHFCYNQPWLCELKHHLTVVPHRRIQQ